MRGIYAITCDESGLSYIGQALDIEKRWGQHLHALEETRHPCRSLQDDWNTFGAAAMTFSILELTPLKLGEREWWWIRWARSQEGVYVEQCISQAEADLSVGAYVSKETREALDQWARQRKTSRSALCRDILEAAILRRVGTDPTIEKYERLRSALDSCQKIRSCYDLIHGAYDELTSLGDMFAAIAERERRRNQQFRSLQDRLERLEHQLRMALDQDDLSDLEIE